MGCSNTSDKLAIQLHVQVICTITIHYTTIEADKIPLCLMTSYEPSSEDTSILGSVVSESTAEEDCIDSVSMVSGASLATCEFTVSWVSVVVPCSDVLSSGN